MAASAGMRAPPWFSTSCSNALLRVVLFRRDNHADCPQFSAGCGPVVLERGQNVQQKHGNEIVLHSQEMEKVQHTVFRVLAETALYPTKIELMEPPLENLLFDRKQL